VKRQKLTLKNVTANRLALVATTCSGCGKVTVSHAGDLLGRVNLDRAKTTRHKILTLPLGELRTGNVVIKVISRGKPVKIDGLGVASL